MDGRVPVGYSPRDRKLLVNKKAEQARRIFELGCVAQLRGIDLIGKELKQGAHQPVWPKVRRDRSSTVSGAKTGAR
jgi:hypothetical protein